MNIKVIVAIVLLVAGTLALVYQGFSYTAETHDAEVGPFDFQWSETEWVAIPTWMGVIAIIVGGGILIADRFAAT